ncbi:MAG: cupin domain-containing protein [Terriglobia bacterium]
MLTRRESAKALAGIIAAGISGMAGSLDAAEPAQGARRTERSAVSSSRVQEILQHMLPGMDNHEVTLVVVHYAPGEGSKPHRHPGPVFGYILEGTIISQVEPGPPITYQQGQAFYEPPMHVHRISQNASKTRPAKLLAFNITEKGQPLTLPADQQRIANRGRQCLYELR